VRFGIRRTALILILSFGLGTATTYAETITANGTNGTFPGGEGGDATANAGPGPGPDATNIANAIGGNGLTNAGGN
jgi:hypothetical protein